MTAEAALLLFLIKNLKALPEWTPKVKKQKANKMLCLLMSLKLNLTIAGSCYLLGFVHVCGWVFCIRLAVKGMGEVVEITEVSIEWRTCQGCAGAGGGSRFPPHRWGWYQIFQEPDPSPSPLRDPSKMSAQCPLALLQLVINRAPWLCLW